MEDSLEDINKEILECARYGEDLDLRVLIGAGGDVNYQDGAGNTALHRAAGKYFASIAFFINISK